jgi:NAD(P)-dependent dehydrogenase (short-subunit alcohol dehydrogenase family)
MKNILVIGGSSGIGASIVQDLGAQGHRVYATFCGHPTESSHQVKFFQFDVLKDQLDLDLLPEELHGVVYCPGAINLKPFHRLKDEEFLSDFELQSLGAVRVIRQVLPRLKKSKNASIVLFSTIAVQKGFNFHASVSMSKGAIEGLTRALAAEFAPGIRVNALAPALTDTPLAHQLLNTDKKKEFHADKNPLKKVGSPSDIAEAAVFLLTDKSAWMTGQILHIDGGSSVIG